MTRARIRPADWPIETRIEQEEKETKRQNKESRSCGDRCSHAFAVSHANLIGKPFEKPAAATRCRIQLVRTRVNKPALPMRRAENEPLFPFFCATSPTFDTSRMRRFTALTWSRATGFRIALAVCVMGRSNAYRTHTGSARFSSRSLCNVQHICRPSR